MKTKLMIYADSDIELVYKHLHFEEKNVKVNDLLTNGVEPTLFEKKHDELLTQFDFTEVDSCWILLFDRNGLFQTVKPHTYSEKAISQYTIQDPYLLILPKSYKIKFDAITHFNFPFDLKEPKEQPRRWMENKIKFVCKMNFEVGERSLIVNVDAIDRIYPGGFKEFFLSDDFEGVTNGFIFMSTQTMSENPKQDYIIKDVLEPMGFEYGKHYLISDVEDEDGTDNEPWYKRSKWFKSNIGMGYRAIWHSDFHCEKELYINGIVEERPWLQYWYFWFKKHPLLRDLRIITTKKGPRFTLDSNRFEFVSDKVFFTPDETAIPLFLGSQFGLYPREESVPDDYEGFVAVLGKSLLSGVVAGVGIQYFSNGKLGELQTYLDNRI